MQLAVIVPCLNESERIAATLAPLRTLRKQGHQIIVVDGGSEDNSIELAKPLADTVVTTQCGRACQMNHGASLTKADILLFLHADTLLPSNAAELICQGLISTHKDWGRFDVKLSGNQYWLRVVEFMMNQRSRITGIATGDQALFVRRELFDKAGGFPEIPLMEDVELSKQLKKTSRPLCLKERVITSSRRWEQQGVWRTIVLMWRLRLAYFFGADPSQLKQQYDN